MNGKVSNLMQLACVRRYTLTEGKEAGLRVIEVNNGVLRFLLNESKALDIMQLFHKGANISFVSKNGFTAREIPFTRRFEGGMLYTCGLDSVGGREGFELHGSLHGIPAKVLSAECDGEGIVVKADIEDGELFGKNLLLRRLIRTEIGSDSLTVEDNLVNRGARDEAYCLLYHINLGYPMLDEGVEIETEAKKVVPRTPWAAERKGDRSRFTDAVEGEEERCYFLAMDRPRACVVNRRLGKTFELDYSGDTLPHFVQWNSAAAGDYALGLEPSTTELDDRFSYRTLKKGEEVRFCLKLAVTERDPSQK